MHPLQPNFSDLTDQQLDEKINEISRNYFQAVRLYPQAANQVSMVLDGIKWEKTRRLIEKEKQKEEDGSSDINDLIKVNR
jgi:hypothetical protein